MKVLLIVFVALLTLNSNIVNAKVEIKNFAFENRKKEGRVRVNYRGDLNEPPYFKIVSNALEVYFPSSFVKQAQGQNISFLTKNKKETKIVLYDHQKNTVKMKITFPEVSKQLKDRISISVKDNHFDIVFPKWKYKAAKNKALVKATPTQKRAASSIAEKLDESFLQKLIDDENKKNPAKEAAVVKEKQAQSTNKNTFSFSSYVIKIVAFLGLVVVFFYGVMLLFKRGVSRKTKMGFLSKADLIEVLATHYISPKKSILLVRVHEQIFMVSDSDNGLQFMTEVSEVNGLLKEGEKRISGENFDTNLDTQSELDQSEKVVLKQDILQSNDDNKTDKVKFSDQLKKKMQGLKPLQQ